MARFGLVFLFFAFVSADCLAEVTSEVLEFGYYQATGKIVRERNLSTPTGYERTTDRVRLMESTNVIPMRKGQLFGFKFKIKGFPKDQVAVQLRLVVTHPQITRPNGSVVGAYQYPVTLDVVGGVVENRSGYSLDHDYELVEGDWRFQYWLKDKMLLEQSFTVKKHIPKPKVQGVQKENASAGKKSVAGQKQVTRKKTTLRKTNQTVNRKPIKPNKLKSTKPVLKAPVKKKQAANVNAK